MIVVSCTSDIKQIYAQRLKRQQDKKKIAQKRPTGI